VPHDTAPQIEDMTFARTERDDDENALRSDFWRKVARVVAQIPFAADLLAAYYSALDQETPRHVKVTLFGAIAYFVLPIDAIPDMLPVIGFTDDAAVLATAIKLVTDHITPRHREQAKIKLTEISAQS
jgi:uncharacterized membrane protein YkvA (DUF1232 family)